MATMGSGTMTYEVVEGWAQLPEGWSFKECAGVAVDSKDRVYVFNRGEHPLMVFHPDGTLESSWGEGVFYNPHGICIGPDGSVYCVDNGDHTVRKFTAQGELLMTLGSAGSPSTRYSGQPFNSPTHLAVSHKTGELFISDGYGNARVHRYSAEGEYIDAWGASGIDEGHFVIPHNITVDGDDNIYVADRECHRVQIFDAKGNFQGMWNNIWKACGITVGGDGNIYVAELIGDEYYTDAPDVGHRVSIYSSGGKLLTRLGDSLPGEGLCQFIAPHGIAVDSRGDIYVSEVSWTMMGRNLDSPREMRSLQKLARCG